jgi:hypothetical protein
MGTGSQTQAAPKGTGSQVQAAPMGTGSQTQAAPKGTGSQVQTVAAVKGPAVQLSTINVRKELGEKLGIVHFVESIFSHSQNKQAVVDFLRDIGAEPFLVENGIDLIELRDKKDYVNSSERTVTDDQRQASGDIVYPFLAKGVIDVEVKTLEEQEAALLHYLLCDREEKELNKIITLVASREPEVKTPFSSENKITDVDVNTVIDAVISQLKVIFGNDKVIPIEQELKAKINQVLAWNILHRQ